MNFTPELLAPAGSYEIGLAALYSGADAIYLGLDRFGARAYAHNFSYDELVNIVNIANILNKKIYVTCNTLIKDSELADIYEFLDKIYDAGVHGIITTDFAVIKYVINNLPDIECHISTQVGIKCLEDTIFFKEIKADRTVLARECSIDEIKRIKENINIPIEVFAHGALCVSYSGNCFFSSLLTLRSGNRGRCSQNCRREYRLLKDGKIVSDKSYLLSTKDLNTFDLLPKLKELKIDSLKIEGRMKDINYVKVVVSSYKKKLENDKFKTDMLDKIFHREYTKGFIANVENHSIVNKNRSGNVGQYIGKIKRVKPNLYELNLKEELKLQDRIRIVSDKDYYLDVDNIYDKNLKPITSSKTTCYLKLNIILNTGEVYIIKNRNLDASSYNKIPLNIYISIVNKDIYITANYDNLYFNYEEKNYLEYKRTIGLTKNDFIKQFSKLQDTPFYLANLEISDEINNYFLNISKINELRRNIINTIYNSYKKDKIKLPLTLPKLEPKDKLYDLIITCHNDIQYKILKEYENNKDLKIKVYFNNDYAKYTEVKKFDSDNLLISNYGSIYLNKNKNLILNKEFNVTNYNSLAYFLELANTITLSSELSYKEIRDLVLNFYNHYNFYPNTSFIIYTHMSLMTLKYCPIKNSGYCPECKKYQFALKDNNDIFYLITDNNCINTIINGKATNLIDEIPNLKEYIKTFRIDFTIEDESTCLQVVNNTIKAILGEKTNTFNKVTDTRAYYQRKIL